MKKVDIFFIFVFHFFSFFLQFFYFYKKSKNSSKGSRWVLRIWGRYWPNCPKIQTDCPYSSFSFPTLKNTLLSGTGYKNGCRRLFAVLHHFVVDNGIAQHEHFHFGSVVEILFAILVHCHLPTLRSQLFLLAMQVCAECHHYCLGSSNESTEIKEIESGNFLKI